MTIVQHLFIYLVHDGLQNHIKTPTYTSTNVFTVYVETAGTYFGTCCQVKKLKSSGKYTSKVVFQQRKNIVVRVSVHKLFYHVYVLHLSLALYKPIISAGTCTCTCTCTCSPKSYKIKGITVTTIPMESAAEACQFRAVGST